MLGQTLGAVDQPVKLELEVLDVIPKIMDGMATPGVEATTGAKVSTAFSPLGLVTERIMDTP